MAIEYEKTFKDAINDDSIRVYYYGITSLHDVGLIIDNLHSSTDVLLSEKEFERFYQHLTKIRESFKPRYHYEKVDEAVYQIHDRKLGYLKCKLFGVNEELVADIVKKFNERENDVL